MVKKFGFLLISTIVDVAVFSLGGKFILLAFLIPFVSLVVMGFLFQNENNRTKAFLTLTLMLIFSIGPMAIAHIWNDSGALVFTAMFTAIFIIFPFLIVAAFLFLKSK